MSTQSPLSVHLAPSAQPDRALAVAFLRDLIAKAEAREAREREKRDKRKQEAA